MPSRFWTKAGNSWGREAQLGNPAGYPAALQSSVTIKAPTRGPGANRGDREACEILAVVGQAGALWVRLPTDSFPAFGGVHLDVSRNRPPSAAFPRFALIGPISQKPNPRLPRFHDRNTCRTY